MLDKTMQHEPPEASFERACAAFDGASEDFSSFEARKLFTIVAGSLGADTTIDRQGLHVAWPRRRKQFHYIPALGPSIIAGLRAHAPAGTFDCAFDLAQPILAKLCLFKSPAPMRFWVRRSVDRITIFARPATAESAALEDPQPLEPWLSKKAFANFSSPRRCVHCGVFSDRFRYAASALICLACGRSHSVHTHELKDATFSD